MASNTSEYNKAYHAKHKDKLNAKSRLYYQQNRERIKAKARQKYHDKKEPIKAETKSRAILLDRSPYSWLTSQYLDQYDDYFRFSFLYKTFYHYAQTYKLSSDWVKQCIEYFYNEPYFILCYDRWSDRIKIEHTYMDNYKPSLDHKIPLSRGGGHELNNIHFITLFENLCKKDMTWGEWAIFQEETSSQSNLFFKR